VRGQSPLVASNGPIRLALRPEGGTQIEECVDIVGVERQSVQVTDDGLVELSLRAQSIAEIVVRGRIRRIARERPRYQFSSLSVLARWWEMTPKKWSASMLSGSIDRISP